MSSPNEIEKEQTLEVTMIDDDEEEMPMSVIGLILGAALDDTDDTDDDVEEDEDEFEDWDEEDLDDDEEEEDEDEELS